MTCMARHVQHVWRAQQTTSLRAGRARRLLQRWRDRRIAGRARMYARVCRKGYAVLLASRHETVRSTVLNRIVSPWITWLRGPLYRRLPAGAVRAAFLHTHCNGMLYMPHATIVARAANRLYAVGLHVQLDTVRVCYLACLEL